MTRTTTKNTVRDIGLGIINMMILGVYFLIAFVYNVLISVSKAEIIDGQTVAGVFSRVQIIIGVFMLFRISISILQGIADPDKATDSKTGMGNMIIKIIISLSLLTLLVPIDYKKPSGQLNKFEEQVSKNGILFGTLYDFQRRIVTGNVIAKIIISDKGVNNNVNQANIDSSGEELSGLVLKSFLTPNLLPSASKNFKLIDGSSGEKEFQDKDLFCNPKATSPANIYYYYYRTNDPNALVNMSLAGCRKKGVSGRWSIIDWEADSDNDDYYAFQFNWFIGLIVGILFLVILVLLTIEVAKRAIKIAILRLIAPIPIISYMAPQSDMQNGPFGAWVKTLTSTYLDLFIQLSVIYFALFIIMSIRRAGGIEFDQDVSGAVWLFAHVFVYIGLILFAKDAPKFLKQALGLKEEGGVFSALKGNLDGLKSLGAGAAGIAGGAVSGAMAASQNNKNVGRGLLKGLGGGVKNAGAGILGGKSSKDMMAQNRAYNAQNYANARDKSDWKGRMKAGWQDRIGLENDYQKYDKKISDYNDAKAAWDRLDTALNSNDKRKVVYDGESIKDSNGRVVLQKGGSYSAKYVNDQMDYASSSGDMELREKLKDARGKIHGDVWDEIRKTDAKAAENLTGADRQIYQATQSIYDIGSEYKNDPDQVFAGFKNTTSMADDGLNMGENFKGAAMDASRESDSISHSTAYAKSKADAQRVSEKNDK